MQNVSDVSFHLTEQHLTEQHLTEQHLTEQQQECSLELQSLNTKAQQVGRGEGGTQEEGMERNVLE